MARPGSPAPLPGRSTAPPSPGSFPCPGKSGLLLPQDPVEAVPVDIGPLFHQVIVALPVAAGQVMPSALQKELTLRAKGHRGIRAVVFSSITRCRPFIWEKAAWERSSSSGCSLDPARWGVRGSRQTAGSVHKGLYCPCFFTAFAAVSCSFRNRSCTASNLLSMLE